MMPKNNLKNKKSGFTILIAVITAGILLIIAMSIGGIALKEQVLSTANKESQVAYYAADTAMECVLHWDQKKGVFSKTPTPSAPIDCNGNLGIAVTKDAGSNQNFYSYTFKIDGIKVGIGSDTTCALVEISKTKNDIGTVENPRDPNKVYTDIRAYGYNTCDASLRRLERAIEAHY